MRRNISVGNKICFNRELQQSYKAHVRNMKSIERSTRLDCKSPKTFVFLERRLKPKMLLKAKLDKIDFDNERLTLKINSYHIATERNRHKLVPFILPKYKILKKLQEEKIAEENRLLRARIENKESFYNTREFIFQREATEKYINNISNFKYKSYEPNKTLVNFYFGTPDSVAPSQDCRPRESREGRLIYEMEKEVGGRLFFVECRLGEDRLQIALRGRGGDQAFRLSLELGDAVQLIDKHFEGMIDKLIDTIKIDQAGQQCYIDVG